MKGLKLNLNLKSFKWNENRIYIFGIRKYVFLMIFWHFLR